MAVSVFTPMTFAPPFDVQIRPATAADAADIAEIYNQYVRDGRFTMDTLPWSPAGVAAWLDELGDRERMLVLSVDSRVAGWGIVKRYSDRDGYRVCCETSLYLDRSHAQRGLGSQLMEALFACCHQLGYHHAVARIRAANEASVRFHQQHGFEWVGRQREIGFVNGRWEDVVIMQRIFEEVPAPPT